MNRITKGESLSQVSIGLLFYLSLNGKAKITEIAERFCITPSAATAMVDKLEEEDLVARHKNKEDRRVVWVNLTEKGHEKIRGLFSDWEENELISYGERLTNVAAILDGSHSQTDVLGQD
jgi:DNA-binding MarR family transcriptional regulator